MSLDALADFVSSGRIVDVIIGFMLLEAALIAGYHRRTGRGLAAVDAVANLAAGASLLVAVRLALTHEPWIWIPVALAASLAAHLFDLSRRWSGSR